MKRALALCVLVVVTACGKHHAAAEQPIDGTAINNAIHDLADRTCGCNNELGCVKGVRNDWDKWKKEWIGARAHFPPGQQVVFDSEFGRMASCGDAAGLTFWREL